MVLYFSVKPGLEQNPVYSYEFVLNKNEVYCRYEHRNSSFVSMIALNSLGVIQHFIWNDRKNDWEIFSTAMADQCAIYVFCGAYATCTANKSPPCACLKGFMAKSVDWSDGCIQMTPLVCDGKDRFFKHTGLKLPDTSHSWANESTSLQECEELCLRNCSCTAYANLNILKGTGCLIWFNDLIDMTEFSKVGQDLNIRLAASKLDWIQGKRKPKGKLKAEIISISILIVAFVLYLRKKKLVKEGKQTW